MKLNSVIFHTNNLKTIRSFYHDVLGLSIGQYLKDGVPFADESKTYVNFDLNGTLLCFEVEADRVDRGTIVLTVPDLDSTKSALSRSQVRIVKESSSFLIALDPENREVIFEPSDEEG